MLQYLEESQLSYTILGWGLGVLTVALTTRLHLRNEERRKNFSALKMLNSHLLRSARLLERHRRTLRSVLRTDAAKGMVIFEYTPLAIETEAVNDLINLDLYNRLTTLFADYENVNHKLGHLSFSLNRIQELIILDNERIDIGKTFASAQSQTIQPLNELDEVLKVTIRVGDIVLLLLNDPGDRKRPQKRLTDEQERKAEDISRENIRRIWAKPDDLPPASDSPVTDSEPPPSPDPPAEDSP